MLTDLNPMDETMEVNQSQEVSDHSFEPWCQETPRSHTILTWLVLLVTD